MTHAATSGRTGDGPRRLLLVQLAAVVVLAATGVVLLARHDTTTTGFNGVRGSGRAATPTRPLAPFTRVELAGANRVTVHVGGRQALTVRGDDNLLELVTTEVAGGTLTIGNRESFSTRAPMSVDVTVPALDTVALAGSGLIVVTGVHGAHFTVRAPGSGVVHA